MVNQQRPVFSGCSSQASSGNAHPLYRRQCLGQGCSSGTRGTIVSWSLDKRPIPTPYQCPCNDGYFHGSGKSTSCNPQATVVIATDSASVYHKTLSPALYMEVWNLLLWCHQRGITLKVRHIPGRFNILADRLPRMLKPVPTEWCLNQTIAYLVFSVTGCPSIDLFATRLNNRLPMYVSPIPDSKALAIDALSISWDHIHGYAFPPFHAIPAILNKICMF